MPNAGIAFTPRADSRLRTALAIMAPGVAYETAELAALLHCPAEFIRKAMRPAIQAGVVIKATVPGKACRCTYAIAHGYVAPPAPPPRELVPFGVLPANVVRITWPPVGTVEQMGAA